MQTATLTTRRRPFEPAGSKYQVLFTENPFPMWIYDVLTLQFLAVNDAAVTMYGYSAEEFRAMHLPDIRRAEELPRLLHSVAQDAEDTTGWRHAGQWRHILRSGESVHVEIISHAVEFDGREARMVIVHEVTEHERHKEQLRAAEERMRFALTSSGMGIWEANLVTGVSYWSETCEVMHGLEPGTFGQTFDAFIERIHRDDRPAVRAAIAEGIRDRRPVEVEYRTTRADGSERIVVCTARFFYDAAGVPVRGAGVSFDVTDRRALERQLRQSQKMDAIGRLAGGIAHDFNNMLTAVLGNAELLLEMAEPDTLQQRLLGEIRRAGNNAAALTHQLLAFSRRQVLRMRVLRVRDVVSDTEPMLRRLIGESIRMTASATDTACVVADEAQLQQVIVNLAVNARDAMPAGGQLTIEAGDATIAAGDPGSSSGVPPGTYVTLTVRDTGCGMDDATRRQIFEPFFSTKEQGRGTGLGLATVHGIVEQIGGHILVDSRPGEGTTFRVWLPCTDEPARAAAPVEAAPAVVGGSETILLVEDEDLVRDFVSHVLTKHGYAVYAFATPPRALEFARAFHAPIHLLLTDVVLPDMDGRRLADAVRQLHGETAVLFVSGYTDDVLGRHGVLDPGMQLLEKPLSAERIGAAVRQLLTAA
jgi:PAS domain S-box-containing protein